MVNANDLEIKKLGKVVAYGGNYFGRLIGNYLEPGLNLGHPYAALGFAVSEIITENYEPLKDSIYNTWIKAGGAGYFSFLTIKNLAEFIEGDYSGLKDFPFNLAMAWSLLSESKGLTSKTGIIPKKYNKK